MCRIDAITSDDLDALRSEIDQLAVLFFTPSANRCPPAAARLAFIRIRRLLEPAPPGDPPCAESTP